MYKLEKTVLIIAFISFILKLLKIPFGGMIFGFSMVILVIMYLLFGFALFNKIGFRQIFVKKSYNELSVLRIVGSISAGIVLALICLGIQFKLLFLPGSQILLTTILIPTIVILVISTIKYIKSRADYFKQIIFRLSISGVIGLILFFL